ncbi:hypothetical protein, conserved [Plasmodium gonderi]|uniref:Proteasome assembly chaperone 3 n=1 Tax=Plasmodium gonderi TaxID=77519 RepID=A0A1Y1JJY6_PLAGO|nr:hypothetical protein, conserved [Plasmodium gonderi]GAW82836.1 hypothetical protein, conserved [Plasmodium gonderi]
MKKEQHTYQCNEPNESLASNGGSNYAEGFMKNGIEERGFLNCNDNCHYENNEMKDPTRHKNKGILNDKKNEQFSKIKKSPNNAMPMIRKKNVNINHNEEIVPYVCTLVSYKNYTIFFITPNGKFAVWVHSHNVIFPFSVEQETEIIFGERNYPFLEMFCAKFMKDHAPLLKYKPIIFAISLHKMCFDDTKVLTDIFSTLSSMVK